MDVTFKGDHALVLTDSPSYQRVLIRELNATKTKKGFRLPRTLWVMRELIRAFPHLKQHDMFMHEGTMLRQEMDIALAYRKNVDHWGIPAGTNLRPYQFEDVHYLKFLSAGGGIFNEPRTGKTPTAITLLKELGKKRNLIVAPASLTLNWAKELEKWWPEKHVIVYAGTPSQRKNLYVEIQQTGDYVLIVGKDMWAKSHESFKIVFDTCIVDEAHFLRNYKSAQSKAIFSIQAERRYALSGTPTVKHPSDIFGILHFLYPGRFPSYWQFVERYFEIGQDYMGHQVVGKIKAHREKELQEIVGLLSVQRKRKEVMPWLPDKQRTRLPVELGSKQRKLYEDMRKYFLASEAPNEVDAQNVITQLMRMRQLCLDPRLLGFETPGAKTEALLEFLENHNAPIVVMSWFTSYLKFLQPLIEKLGLKVGMIHGDMSATEKASAAAALQNGDANVLLCNIVSAGVGFTLDNADTILFLDKAWNPSENEQAEDRVCPTVEEKNHKHEIISFVCQGTIEEKIEDILNQKKSLTDIINEGGREAIRRMLA